MLYLTLFALRVVVQAYLCRSCEQVHALLLENSPLHLHSTKADNGYSRHSFTGNVLNCINVISIGTGKDHTPKYCQLLSCTTCQ